MVVHRPRWSDWSFPKGKLKSHETMRACAIREIREEAQVDIALGISLGWQTYQIADGRPKAVHFWAAQVIDPKSPALRARKPIKPASKHEIDRIEWFPVSQALRLLTYQRDAEMLRKLIRRYQQGRLDTQTLIVVRHALAVKRSSWKHGKGPERTRPLTASGELRAQELAGELSAYGINSLRTSTWLRCVSTFEPYAKLTGVNLRRKNEMTERSYTANAKWISQYFQEMLDGLEKNRAICVHRPTLPGFLVRIKKLSGKRQFAKISKNDPWLEPGEMLVLHLAKHSQAKHRIAQIELVSSKITS